MRHPEDQLEVVGNEPGHEDCGPRHSGADRRDSCACHDSEHVTLATDQYERVYAQRPPVHAVWLDPAMSIVAHAIR